MLLSTSCWFNIALTIKKFTRDVSEKGIAGQSPNIPHLTLYPNDISYAWSCYIYDRCHPGRNEIRSRNPATGGESALPPVSHQQLARIYNQLHQCSTFTFCCMKVILMGYWMHTLGSLVVRKTISITYQHRTCVTELIRMLWRRPEARPFWPAILQGLIHNCRLGLLEAHPQIRLSAEPRTLASRRKRKLWMRPCIMAVLKVFSLWSFITTSSLLTWWLTHKAACLGPVASVSLKRTR